MYFHSSRTKKEFPIQLSRRFFSRAYPVLLGFLCALAWEGLTARVLGQATGNTVGVTYHSPAASEGYTLFGLLGGYDTYLVNDRGDLIQRWRSSYLPGAAVYLQEDGHLFRTGRTGSGFNAGGSGGRIEEFSWDGNLIWSYEYATSQVRQHHDTIRLPNGNILIVAWELKSTAQALAAGRRLSLLAFGSLWPDHLVEVQPGGSSGGTIVWEWHAWDHLIQDYDATKANYGVVGAHPELIDINFPDSPFSDWMHVNSVDYNEQLDQIIISVHNFDEIWIIDHSTTTAEAASHSGGRSGKGGDILYRWGNPLAYRAGTEADQVLFGEHNVQWIREGLNGAGHLLIFNNGLGRPAPAFTTIEEIVPPMDEAGHYVFENGRFGPTNSFWSYRASPPESFYAQNISSVQRLPNGNTLIGDGPHGIFFEITNSGEQVWRYVTPVVPGGLLTQGSTPPAQNQVFRAIHYPPDFPGLTGQSLVSLGPLELPADYHFVFTEVDRFEGGVGLRWKSEPDHGYRVLFRPDWETDWQEIGSVFAIGTEASFTDSEPSRVESATGFYISQVLP